MDMCLLIPILVGLISAILGYLLGRLLGGNSNSNNENIDVYKNRISILEADLAACKSSKGSSKGIGNGISSGAGNSGAGSSMMASSLAAGTAAKASESASSGSTTASASYDAAAAKAAIGKKVIQDDLTVVEGIGPKIRELFHNHDVKTWAALADCSVDKCQDVLKSGGKRFEIHKPGTWPKQAGLAAQGKWQELKDWQDELDGGK